MRKFDLNHKVLLVIALVMVGVIVIPYADVLAIAALSAYFASGLYHKRQTKKRGKRRSLPAVWLLLALFWVVPIGGVTYVGIIQSQEIIRQTTKLIKKETDTITAFERKRLDLHDDPVGEVDSRGGEDFENETMGLLAAIEKQVTTYGQKIIKKIPRYFVALMLYIFLVSAFLVHGEYIYDFVSSSLPYSEEMIHMYTAKMTDLLNGIMRGSFIVSLIQGVCIGIARWLVGLPYALTVTIVATVLYVPMIGASVLVLPACVYLFSQGNMAAAVIFFLWASVVVGNIDNVIRDKFLPKGSRLHPALLFLAIVSGMYWFGPMGLFYGPLLAIVALTTLHTYRDGKIIEDNKK